MKIKKISQSHKGKRLSPNTEFKKGLIPKNKGISKYTLFLNNRPAEEVLCKYCNNIFLKRIDKNTKYCSIRCSKIK